jgi:hypothetical protein
VTGTTTTNGALVANGAVTLGDNGDTVAINSSDWDISATGDVTGIGAITTDGNATIGDAATDTFTLNATVQGASPFTFEGATADTNETTLSVVDPTADRTINIPNASGTFAVSASGPISLSAAGDISCATCVTGATAFIQDGNTFGAEAVLGTNDAFALSFETDSVTRLTISDTGTIDALE